MVSDFETDWDLEDDVGKKYTGIRRSIFDVLKGTIEYHADPEAKTKKLIEDVLFCCRSGSRRWKEDGTLYYVWAVILDCAEAIPPHHDWHICLVETVESLRAREDRALGDDESALWKDLPRLFERLEVYWMSTDPTGDGNHPAEFAKYKNLNAFLARLTTPSFAPWLKYPFMIFRSGLEESPSSDYDMECRLWIATEWMLGCADIIFQEIKPNRALSEQEARSYRPGPLYKGEGPLSLERWGFWKKRFLDYGRLEEWVRISEDVLKRLTVTVRRMDSVEKGQVDNMGTEAWLDFS